MADRATFGHGLSIGTFKWEVPKQNGIKFNGNYSVWTMKTGVGSLTFQGSLTSDQPMTDPTIGVSFFLPSLNGYEGIETAYCKQNICKSVTTVEQEFEMSYQKANQLQL